MKAIKFKGCNKIHVNIKNNKQTPCLELNNTTKNTITCHHLSFIEKIIVLFTGRIWLGVETHGTTVPVKITTIRKHLFVFEKKRYESKEEIVNKLHNKYHISRDEIKMLYDNAVQYNEIKDVLTFLKHVIFIAISEKKDKFDVLTSFAKQQKYTLKQ